jgi:hypothetical protein
VLVHKPLVELMTRKIGLKSLNDPIDTTTPQGRLTFNLFASLAEYPEPAVMRSRELDPGQNTPGAPPCRRRQRLRLCLAHNHPRAFRTPPMNALSDCCTFGLVLASRKNQTDDIFLAQFLGHKLLGPNASLSVGQSYKDFYVAGD